CLSSLSPPALTPLLVDEVMKHGLEVVIRRGDLLERDLMTQQQVRQAGVELVRITGLQSERIAFGMEANADYVGKSNQQLGGPPGLGATDIDMMRMFVNEVANVVNVPLRKNLPVVHEKDAGGHRLDFVEYVAGDNHTLSFP